MEHLTALLLWCDRLQAHPGYAELITRHPALPSYLGRGVRFALERRASLLSSPPDDLSETQVEENIARLRTLLTSLKGIDGALKKRAHCERLATALEPRPSLN